MPQRIGNDIINLLMAMHENGENMRPLLLCVLEIASKWLPPDFSCAAMAAHMWRVDFKCPSKVAA